MNSIRDYFKKHRGFAKIWDQLQSGNLVNVSVLGLVVKLFENKSKKSTVFVFSNSSFQTSIVMQPYEISMKGFNLNISDGRNDLTFNLKNVIIEPIVGITTNFKNRNKLRIY